MKFTAWIVTCKYIITERFIFSRKTRKVLICQLFLVYPFWIIQTEIQKNDYISAWFSLTLYASGRLSIFKRRYASNIFINILLNNLSNFAGNTFEIILFGRYGCGKLVLFWGIQQLLSTLSVPNRTENTHRNAVWILWRTENLSGDSCSSRPINRFEIALVSGTWPCRRILFCTRLGTITH